MAATFDIVFEPSRGLVRITLTGFFTASEMEAFAAAQRTVYERLTTPPGQHVTLIDVRACKIQAQEMVEAFRRILRDPSGHARRLAFVTGDSAARMQIRRLIERDSAKVFQDAASAEAWLDQPTAGTACAA